MKNFDDIEKLWRQQNISAPRDSGKVRDTQIAIERDANRYGRLLKWIIFALSFAVVFGQVIAVANYVHAPRPLTLATVLQHGVALAFQLALLVILLRRARVHRALVKKSAANVRENVSVALAIVERQMRAYRVDAWILPFLILLATTSVIENFRLGYFEVTGLIGRLSFIWGLCAIFALVGLRHYRSVLRPQHERLSGLLRELDEV